MMLKKGIFCLIVGLATILNASNSHAYALIDFLLAPQPTPVIDGPTLIPETIVSIYQTMINSYTQTEREIQKDIKNLQTSVDLGIGTVTIGASKDTQKVAKGFLSMPRKEVNKASKDYTGMSAKQLAKVTQDSLTTVSGTLEGISEYKKERMAARVDRVVGLVAASLVIKSGIKNLQETMEKVQNTKINAKDYNQALRDNANMRLIYDQVLSLEQQIIAQRLQIKGAMAEYGITPIHRPLQGE